MFSLRSGFSSLPLSDWFTSAPAALPGPSQGLEDARQAMLALLREAGCDRNGRLERRIALAADAQSLWAMRPELMAAASKLLGEAEAHRRVLAATVHFEDLLPTVARRRRAALTGSRARGPMPQA